MAAPRFLPALLSAALLCGIGGAWAQQTGPSAAPTTTIESHALPPIATAKPVRKPALGNAAVEDRWRSPKGIALLFAAGGYVVAFAAGLIGWWFVQRKEDG